MTGPDLDRDYIATGKRKNPVCPVCGDPSPFIFWVDDRDPEGCPDNPDARNITECPMQMAQARQRAEIRKAAPECFDQNGNMLPGRANEAWQKLFNIGRAKP